MSGIPASDLKGYIEITNTTITIIMTAIITAITTNLNCTFSGSYYRLSTP